MAEPCPVSFSVLRPFGRKVGPGFCPELRLAYSRTRCLPCPALPKGRKSPPGYYANSILEFLLERN